MHVKGVRNAVQFGQRELTYFDRLYTDTENRIQNNIGQNLVLFKARLVENKCCVPFPLEFSYF